MIRKSLLFFVTILLFSFNNSWADNDIVPENDNIEDIGDGNDGEGNQDNNDNNENGDNDGNEGNNEGNDDNDDVEEGEPVNNGSDGKTDGKSDDNPNDETDDDTDGKTDDNMNGKIAGGSDGKTDDNTDGKISGDTDGKTDDLLDAPTRLIKTVSMHNFGGYVVRYGNFNKDDQVDILAVQSTNSTITCLTAFTFDGEILWQVGTPNEKNYNIFSDRPVQVYDWNGDGIDDVIVVMDKRLKIINGLNGVTIKSRKVKASDAVFIGSFWDGKKKILVKDRYSRFWVYNSKLRQSFYDRNNTGHFPIAFDLNRDGIDELLIGYSLYKKKDNKILKKWDLSRKLKFHNDATDVADMSNNRTYQIGIADSAGGTLVGSDGKIIWQKKLKHSQHVVMGHFDSKAPREQQVVFLDRGAAGTLYCYDKKGKLLWKSEPQGRVAILSAVDGWSGNKNESFLLVSRRQMGNPILLNGKGELVAEFPIDPSSLYDKNEPPRKRAKNFAQHFDMYGDGREEILINDRSKIYVYTNNEVMTNSKVSTFEGLPNARIYNATFYTGMQ